MRHPGAPLHREHGQQRPPLWRPERYRLPVAQHLHYIEHHDPDIRHPHLRAGMCHRFFLRTLLFVRKPEQPS